MSAQELFGTVIFLGMAVAVFTPFLIGIVLMGFAVRWLAKKPNADQWTRIEAKLIEHAKKRCRAPAPLLSGARGARHARIAKSGSFQGQYADGAVTDAFNNVIGGFAFKTAGFSADNRMAVVFDDATVLVRSRPGEILELELNDKRVGWLKDTTPFIRGEATPRPETAWCTVRGDPLRAGALDTERSARRAAVKSVVDMMRTQLDRGFLF